MQLHGSKISPFVRHCRIVLINSGLSFTFVETDIYNNAHLSPIAKVPFLYDGDLFLNDSSSIIRYSREKSDQAFLPEIYDFDFFAVCNSVLDSVVNIFLLERTGLGVEQNAYLQRQQTRVNSGLQALDERVAKYYTDVNTEQVMSNDALLRAACFLQWAQFRARIDTTSLPHLMTLVTLAKDNEAFASTAPELSV